MVRKKARHRPRHRASRAGWWIGGGVVVLAALVWVAMRPAGVREVGIPVATLVGEAAPVLEFPDATGRRYRVPERGRPTVLIFHMGLH
jgi:hypothetical protein